jgi:hypothetical protein
MLSEGEKQEKEEKKGRKSVERIYGMTYHISSSPHSEHIHTDYPRVSLQGVMTQG